MGQALRLGVVGAGTISQSVHLESARRAGFEVTRVCDLSPTRASQVAKRIGSRGTTDPAEVLTADDVDAVLVATPGSHSAIAVAVLEAGKHLLVEKPVALSERGIRAVAEAAEGTGLVAQVGYMKMYDPMVRPAHEAITGLTGPRVVRVTVQHPADDPQVSHLRMGEAPSDVDPGVVAAGTRADAAEVALELPWAPDGLRQYFAGVLNGSVIHEFSLLRALGMALPDRWEAQVFPELSDVEPACLLATGAVGDVRYVLSWNWLPEAPRYQEEVVVLARDGGLTLDMARPYLLEDASRLRIVGRSDTGRREVVVDGPAETGFLRQLDHFAACIRGEATPLARVRDALKDVRQARLVAEGIGRSLGLEVAGGGRDD